MTMLTKLFCVLIVSFCERHCSYWWSQRYSFIVNFSEGPSHAEDEENDSNETPACDDDAHKAVLCTHSNFLWRTLVIQMLKKIVSKILCYSLLLFWRKWSCRGCKKQFQWYSCMRWRCSKTCSLFSHKLLWGRLVILRLFEILQKTFLPKFVFFTRKNMEHSHINSCSCM